MYMYIKSEESTLSGVKSTESEVHVTTYMSKLRHIVN